MEALGINLGFLIVQILNFLIMFLILRKWAFIPIVNLLEKRRETIAQGVEDARIAAEARENAEKEAETVLAEARSKAAEEARAITERAEEQAREISAAADAEAGQARAEALAEAELERNRILGEVRGQVAALAMAAAQKLVGDALDEQRQRALIDQFFSGVQSSQVTVLEGASLSGQNAVVTSAVPLTDSEQSTVKSEVLAKLGGGGEVEFKVDPSILGGLVVRVGDKVLDDSVVGKLEGMRQSLG